MSLFHIKMVRYKIGDRTESTAPEISIWMVPYFQLTHPTRSAIALNPTYEASDRTVVILPEHIHCIWTLPENDADFSTRWRLIKSYFSRKCHVSYQGKMTSSRQQKGEKAIWQRRFWEHQIRDDRDFVNHLEYTHYNPVHHGLVLAPKDWQYSSFHRYVEAGVYDLMWGAQERLIFNDNIGKE